MLYPPTNSPILIFSTFDIPSFFVFFHSTFHPKHLTLNIQHLSLFNRTPFAFQNESFYHAKGVLLLFKTSPFASQKDSFCFNGK